MRHTWVRILPGVPIERLTMSKRYVVIGGNPITPYTGTTTFTGLNILHQSDILGECRDAIIEYLYDQCAGLIITLDTHTNTIVDG